MKALFLRWTLSFVGTALLAALVWVFGPFVGALDGVAPRAAIIVVLLALWAGVNLWLDWRRRTREAALARGVAEPDPAAAASAEEAAELGNRLTRAMALLRQARGTRGYLYEQPWYVIIGPPGAGKTTALLNAGLHFPLAEELGQGAVAGVGGTRLCDWWFTDDAVLIDTAGRYTTQDSDAAVDRAGWETFLGLLKRTRARQPLNGVIVAIGLADIAQAPREERMAHATAIHRRLRELRERLGVRLPVYALFTKADLIAGFTEFFDDLDREKRAQVWGTTFPLAASGEPARFADSFRALVDRLEARLLDRLQPERSPDRRTLIAGFPAQMSSLAAPLQEFLTAAFGGSRLDPAPMLRGVYLSSGTQEGTPIDRLTGMLARSFGVDQRRAPSLRPEHGRGYFLTRLFRQVILGEAMLVSEPPGAARRRGLLLAAGYAAALLLVLAGGGLLWRSSVANQQEIARVSAAVDRYREAASKLKLDPVTDGNLQTVAPLLDQARALPFLTADTSGFGFGLSQRAKLAAGTRTIYRDALDRVLLPRLIWRLETQMRGALDRPDFLYQATRVYLMLGSAGPLDPDLVRAWMRLDWEQEFPGPAAAPLRESLARHLDALLAQPLPQITLDGALVDQARATFSRVPPAQRVYSRITPSAAARNLPPWRPADALGAGGASLFARRSGQKLTDGVPGFYTPAGFQKVLLPSLAGAAKQVASESWVLGKQSTIGTSGPQLQTLERDIVQLYEADYARHWDAMLVDLEIAPFRSAQQAVQSLYVLGSPQSPMRALLVAISNELQLSAPPAATAGGAAKPAVIPAATAATAQLRAILGGPDAPPPGAEIDRRYQALRDFAGHGPGAPIDLALQAINGLQQNLAQLANAAPGAPAPPATGDDPLLALRATAAQAPQPVQRWLLEIASNGAALRAGGAREQVASAFNGAGGPALLCQQAVDGRYPFSPSSTSDIPLGDFTRLFAPGGLLDGFFNTELRPFVDTAGRVWTVRAAGGVPAPVSSAALAQFQRAATIRDMFFAAGAAAPVVRLRITPIDLDPGAKQVTLDLGGTSLSYAHGPQRAVEVSWPAQGSGSARLVFDPPGGGTGVIEASGSWALFRLFDEGQLRSQGSPDSYTLSFQEGERRAVFAIQAGSVLNPLAPGVLQGFRCPALH